jgi:hypothetical protein
MGHGHLANHDYNEDVELTFTEGKHTGSHKNGTLTKVDVTYGNYTFGKELS